MTTFTKAKLKKSDKKTNIREYKVAAHKYLFIWEHIYILMSLKAEKEKFDMDINTFLNKLWDHV